MKKLLIPIMFLLCFSACESKSEKQRRELDQKMIKLEQEVMQIHDEAMSKMEDVNNLGKKLKTNLSRVNDSRDSVALAEGLQQLNLADSLMWQWMYNFKKPGEETNREEGLEYLRNERQKISTVKDLMFRSLTLADSLLENVPVR